MTIPDTVQGSILLSAIDFFLSFLIIWGIGLILYLFPYINKFFTLDENKLKSGH
ncbi:MAG: hypothetical protein WCP79_04960 [Bacillota bacterium]